MTSNINKLIRIANFLDQSGKYALSDKFENLIKTSQNLLPTMPSAYESTGAPTTGNPLIDSMFSNLRDSAAGSDIFAGGGMYDMTSPYRSKYGPSGPGILFSPTPAQFAELLKTEKGRKYLAQMEMASGLKAQNYMNLTNQGFISFGKFIAQNLAPGVSQERKQEFVNNVLPGTISGQVSNLLTKYPISQWQPRLAEFETIANSVPNFSSQIKKMINQSVKRAIGDLKYHDSQYYDKIVADPKFQDFSTKYNV